MLLPRGTRHAPRPAPRRRGAGSERPETRAVPAPAGFEEIQSQELSRLFGRMVGIRLAFIPVVGLLALFAALAEPARWRSAFLFALFVPLATFFIAEVLRFRRSGFQSSAVTWNLVGAVVGQVGLAFATGALESPFT